MTERIDIMGAATSGISDEFQARRGRVRLAWPLALVLAAMLWLVAAPWAGAQTVEQPEARKLDQIATSLQNIEASLHQHDLSDAQLQGLRDQVSPFASDLAAIIDHLTPVLAASNTRLEQLGPAPDSKAPPEEPQVTADRAEQQKTHDVVDGLLKRAKLLSVQADQTATQINARRRALFTRSLFERSASPLTRNFWSPLAAEFPRDIDLARNLIGDWAASVGRNLPGGRAAAFGGLLVLIAILYWPLARMGRWVLTREPTIAAPTPLRKILSAWWIALVIASLPIATIFALGELFQAFDLIDLRFQPFTTAVVQGVALVALTAGLGHGLLSPEHANWRLARLSDAAASVILKFAIAIAVIVATTRIGEAFAETIGASVAMETAIRAAGAVVVALIIIMGLWRFGTKSAPSDDVFGPPVALIPDWLGPLRIPLWIVAGAIIACALAGFLVLAVFIADQIVWVTGVVVTVVMASSLIEASIETGCQSGTASGRNMAAIVGLSEHSLGQLSILLSGVVRAIAFVVAWLLILVPWGIQSADMSSYLHAAFLGFKFDDMNISLSSIGIALVMFAAGYAITRRIVRWLETAYLPNTSMDIGLRNAVKTSLGYIGISIAALISLAYVGVSFEKLAIFASALSIGIGFGLQSIVNNFVSGLIILWERAIRVGDWIVVGSDEGFVRRINVRSTEIETFDRAAVIIPNSNLVTGVVKNFVRTDRVGRIRIVVDVDLSADPEKVRDALSDIVRGHELVLETPAPFVTFNGFDSSHLHFELFCFVADVATMSATKSDLNFAIFRRFKPQGWLAGPPPSSIVTLAGLEKFEPLLQKVMTSVGPDGLSSAKESR
jgi:potassium-dependent mechanosensitive channel